MSDLPMKQEDHPAHNVPDASEHYTGDTLSSTIEDAIDQTNRANLRARRQAPTAASELMTVGIGRLK